MSRPSEDDREAVDRAFAELVAGYHLTSDRPDPLQKARLDQPGLDQAPLDQTARDQTVLDPTPLDQTTLDQSVLDQSVLDQSVLDRLAPDQSRSDPQSSDQSALDQLGEPSATATEAPAPGTIWADNQPLFQFPEPEAPAEQPEPEDRFVPAPPMPLPRPEWPVLLAWIAMGYAVLAVLAVALGAKLPAWAGWTAIIGFVGGFAILLTRLPRHRPPDAGNGAVL